MGRDYWRGLLDQMRAMAEAGTIDQADLDLVAVTDSPDEAMAVLEQCAVRRFGLQPAPARKSRWWLLERPLI
jgi:predicted Rossmann-fold nucleotide-binding protein